MPLKLDVKRVLTSRSERVKCVDLHPTEPWMLASLYNGQIHIWNYENQQIVKTFEVCDLPVRATKFITRKNWIVCGSDDMHIRVYNYNTLERCHSFEAHSDYIRSIIVHPNLSYILTSSDSQKIFFVMLSTYHHNNELEIMERLATITDLKLYCLKQNQDVAKDDMTIKLWDWDKKWVCAQVFEGHHHYVMQIALNFKDHNVFASASLDRTIKVWQLGSSTPNFSLEGHDKGVNCVNYHPGKDKPYIISGADDFCVKIWDYQNKACIQTLEGHTQNISCVVFHPELPIILSGSEDGTLRVWHAVTYRLETTINNGFDRIWTLACIPGSNTISIGYDDGSIIIKMGREEPAMSMDTSGRLILARHSQLQQANIKSLQQQNFFLQDCKDGEKIALPFKDMGSCEIYPQSISHSPNGRFVAVCGDGEYIIYTAMALRNKSFGSALEFVWCSIDSSVYAIREGTNSIKVFKNFKEHHVIKCPYGAEKIFTGPLLGVKSYNSLAFYNWETFALIRRIEIQADEVYWAANAFLVSICTSSNFYVLKYNEEMLDNVSEEEDIDEDGIEAAFSVLYEICDTVKTGIWIGDCFIYTNSANRLHYCVGQEIVTIAHLDKSKYVLGYIPDVSRLFLYDKDLNITSYTLLLSVLQYQTAIMRKDFECAENLLVEIPNHEKIRVARFLEKQGYKEQALQVSTDPEHRFELALNLEMIDIVYDLATELECEDKWKQLSALALRKANIDLVKVALTKAQDFAALLSIAHVTDDADLLLEVGEQAQKLGQNNIYFTAMFMLGRADACLDNLIKCKRLPEAAFFAKTYIPTRLNQVFLEWKQSISKSHPKIALSLASPEQYGNLFPGLEEAIAKCNKSNDEEKGEVYFDSPPYDVKDGSKSDEKDEASLCTKESTIDDKSTHDQDPDFESEEGSDVEKEFNKLDI